LFSCALEIFLLTYLLKRNSALGWLCSYKIGSGVIVILHALHQNDLGKGESDGRAEEWRGGRWMRMPERRQAWRASCRHGGSQSALIIEVAYLYYSW